jgi:hypothetical protein
MATCSLNKSDRDAIVAEARRKIACVVDNDSRLKTASGDLIGGVCLYAAWAVYDVLRDRPDVGRVVLQAGSCSWPLINESEDDGVRPTHFSYVWDATSYEAEFVRRTGWPALVNVNGLAVPSLPEMYVWVGLVDSQEIIDLTAGDLPARAKIGGLVWTAPKPPDYLWVPVAKLPDRVLYKPEPDATVLALRIMKRMALNERELANR